MKISHDESSPLQDTLHPKKDGEKNIPSPPQNTASADSDTHRLDDIKASIIICTYNRSSSLEKTLDALTEQTMSPESFEVIVVDDGSHDNTARVCTAIMPHLPHMKYIRLEKNSGLANAGNRAVTEAKGEYLLFTDDDCRPHRQWVQGMCQALDESLIVAGTVVSPVSPYFMLCHNIAHFHPFMPGQKARQVEFIAGANMGIRRHAFETIGGFHTGSIIPDMEFILQARQQGLTITFTTEAQVSHYPDRNTLGQVVKYAANHAAHTILLRRRFRQLLHVPRFIFSPTLLLLASPIIAFKSVMGIFLGNRKMLRYLHTLPVIFLNKLAWCWGAAQGLIQEKKRKNK